MKKHVLPILSAVLILVFAAPACIGLPTPSMTTTPPVTDTHEATATSTPKPTSTPRPTSTPNLAATQKVEEFNARIGMYVDEGYLSSTEGKYFGLDDYSREMAKINFMDYDLAGYNDLVQNFAVWGNVKMESARPVAYPEYSGCGFSFRIDPANFDGYTAQITNDAVFLTYCNNSVHRCGEIGKTRGKGDLKLPNPAEVSMELIVNEDHAYVLVDHNFIGEYTLFSDKMREPGYVLYSIISGTNADYGTRCEITNAGLWVSK